MNPDELQAVEDEDQDKQEAEDDIDYDAIYGGIEVNPDEYERPKELQKDYLTVLGENAKDFGKQAIKETLIGFGGAYGDLQALIGGGKETSGAEDQRNSLDFQTLEKMEQPGYTPSFSDIFSLSGDDFSGPGRLPTSSNLEAVNDFIGGPGQPTTPGGKYGKRTGRVYGSGLAFGQVNPGPALAAGAAGEGAEALGAGPLGQAAAEIVTLLLTQGRSRGLSSGNPEVEQRIQSLRNVGYTDEEITLAINSAYKDSNLAKRATKSATTEEAFENFATKSDEIVSDIIQQQIPGIEHGTQYVHQMASDAYGQVARNAANLTIRDSTPFINSATSVVRQVRNTLGRNPEAEGFLNRLADAVLDSTRSPSAETFMNFYKELNGLGKWMGRNQRERLLTEVKNGIKDTFRSEGPAGRQLAEEFERVNEGVRRAFLAEDAMTLLNKSATQDGINYTQLRKVFDKAENVQLLEDVLGQQATHNLRLVSNAGKDVKDFNKAWKATTKSGNNPLGLFFLLQGDLAAFAKYAGAKVSGDLLGKLAEKSLTDPKYQRLWVKGLHAVKENSPQLLKSAQKGMQEYLIEQGIEVEL